MMKLTVPYCARSTPCCTGTEIRHLQESQPILPRHPQHVPTYVPIPPALASCGIASKSCTGGCTGLLQPVDLHRLGNASAKASALRPDSRAAIAERSTTQRPSVITKNEISESLGFLSFSRVLRP